MVVHTLKNKITTACQHIYDTISCSSENKSLYSFFDPFVHIVFHEDILFISEFFQTSCCKLKVQMVQECTPNNACLLPILLHPVSQKHTRRSQVTAKDYLCH